VKKRKKKRGSLNFGQKFGQTRIKFAHRGQLEAHSDSHPIFWCSSVKLGRIVALESGRWECRKSHTAKRRRGAGVWTPVRKPEGTRKSPAKFKPVAGRCHGALSVRTCLQRAVQADGDGSLQYSREISHSTLKAGFLAVFAGGP